MYKVFFFQSVFFFSEKYYLIGTVNDIQGLVSLFNGISTFVGYLMPKPFY